jgi:hypothetical protein
MTKGRCDRPVTERQFLERAVLMALNRQACGPAAQGLVVEIRQRVSRVEIDDRLNRRRTRGLAKLEMGVAAILGDLLVAWQSSPSSVPVWRSLKADLFARTPVGRRTFHRIMDVLIAEELVQHKRGGHPPPTATSIMGQAEGQGRSSRFWPTEALLQLAHVHGLGPATIKAAFPRRPQDQGRSSPPKAAQIVFKPLAPKFWRPTATGTVPVPRAITRDALLSLPSGAPSFKEVTSQLEADVEAQNGLAATCSVTLASGQRCQAPRWYRLFHGSPLLHGRWYARGPTYDPDDDIPASYMSLPRAVRTGLRIDQQATVEIDITASHLTLLLALHKLPPLTKDPYAVLDLPRPLVKQWIVETLGKGHPPRRPSAELRSLLQASSSPTDAPGGCTTLKALGRMILHYYPCLEAPSCIVPTELVEETGFPAEVLLTYYLGGLEARAITAAMAQLRHQQILALPVHDSLIVPISAAAKARAALRAAYRTVCGCTPMLK